VQRCPLPRRLPDQSTPPPVRPLARFSSQLKAAAQEEKSSDREENRAAAAAAAARAHPAAEPSRAMAMRHRVRSSPTSPLTPSSSTR